MSWEMRFYTFENKLYSISGDQQQTVETERMNMNNNMVTHVLGAEL